MRIINKRLLVTLLLTVPLFTACSFGALKEELKVIDALTTMHGQIIYPQKQPHPALSWAPSPNEFIRAKLFHCMIHASAEKMPKWVSGNPYVSWSL